MGQAVWSSWWPWFSISSNVERVWAGAETEWDNGSAFEFAGGTSPSSIVGELDHITVPFFHDTAYRGRSSGGSARSTWSAWSSGGRSHLRLAEQRFAVAGSLEEREGWCATPSPPSYWGKKLAAWKDDASQNMSLPICAWECTMKTIQFYTVVGSKGGSSHSQWRLTISVEAWLVRAANWWSQAKVLQQDPNHLPLSGSRLSGAKLVQEAPELGAENIVMDGGKNTCLALAIHRMSTEDAFIMSRSSLSMSMAGINLHHSSRWENLVAADTGTLEIVTRSQQEKPVCRLAVAELQAHALWRLPSSVLLFR